MARKVICASAAEAVAGIADGATIMIGGFAGYGVPLSLMEALVTRGVRDLTLICNDTVNLIAGKVSPVLLVESGCVRKVICSFPLPASANYDPKSAEGLYRSGEVAVEVVPQGTLAERIRCGGAGIPAFYTPTGAGTSFAAGKEVRLIDGLEYLLETALHADFALVRAHRGDSLGNLVYRRSARNFNPIMATAAHTTIAEVNEIVPAGSLDPEVIGTPGIFVHRLYAVG